MMQYHICRLCQKAEYESAATSGPMLRYSIRHYVHQSCGFEKWGAGFLDKLTPVVLRSLAFMDLEKRGLLGEVRRRIEAAESKLLS